VDLNLAMREPILELFLTRLARRQPSAVLRGLRMLQPTVGQVSASRVDALAWIRRGLEQDAALNAALACLFHGERTDALAAVGPYLQELGEPFFRHAAWELGREEDRRRRDLIVRALRGGGEQAELAILQVLRPSMPWFHSRNLLQVLSSLGSSRSTPKLLPFLNHDDPRVRITALRALRKCAGKEAVPHLIACLSDSLPLIQQEAIHLLGHQKALPAASALGMLALDIEAPLQSRIKAVETLGILKSPVSAAPLTSLIKRRGGLFHPSDPDSLRLAAARVLVLLPGGKEALRQIIKKEGSGGLAQAFLRILEG
jgi:HEAT repeat protein